MRFTKNLELYVLAGVLVYLVRTLNLEQVFVLLEHIFIAVAIGKTIEITLTKIFNKTTLSSSMSFVLSVIILIIILLVMKKIGLIIDVLEILPISLGISIFMSIVIGRRYKVYNEKLEKFKKELEVKDYENN